jgi:hypothetical protein
LGDGVGGIEADEKVNVIGDAADRSVEIDDVED